MGGYHFAEMFNWARFFEKFVISVPHQNILEIFINHLPSDELHNLFPAE
jgi:hypothetical protein